MFYANGNQETARAATLISDNEDLKSKSVTGNKEAHYIMIKCKFIKRIY